MLSQFSCVRLFVTLWITARQAPLSMGFFRQEYWSRLSCPPPGNLPKPRIKPMSLLSPASTGGFFATVWPGKLLLKGSVQFSLSVMCDSLWPRRLQHTRLPCPSPTPGACSNSFPSSQWCHPTISSSVIPLSSCPLSFPASGSLLMSQFFTSDGQNIGDSASASVLPMNIQDWFPLGLTSLISLQSKGPSRVFSNTTVQKHQLFGAQLSLWSNSHIQTWLLGKP